MLKRTANANRYTSGTTEHIKRHHKSLLRRDNNTRRGISVYKFSAQWQRYTTHRAWAFHFVLSYGEGTLGNFFRAVSVQSDIYISSRKLFLTQI